MFATISARIPRDRDYPGRARELDIFRRILNGTFYDVLPHPFHEERKETTGEYVPLRHRRPCIRYALCRLVVEDSVALLFGEGRFPAIECEDERIREVLEELILEARLLQVMTAAALQGSVGSVAVLMRVLKGRVFFKVVDAPYLTPEWDPEAPDTLVRVTEKYKVRGEVLRDQGYTIADTALAADHWFMRVWDATDETWFLPWPVMTNGVPTEAAPAKDKQRSVRHGLGFVPMVWIRNLPSSDDVDGGCTFRAAIETSVELDYLLSAGHRAGMYFAAPTLTLKDPAVDPSGQLVIGPGDAIIVSEKGDAKLLEIDGSASSAVIEYAMKLRELALESIHGNRASSDKVSAAQSGRALEMLHQPLIQLADMLRTAYGNDGLLPLLRMVLRASSIYPLKVNGKSVGRLNETTQITLRWPAFFHPTHQDKQQEADTLATLANAGHISRESAVAQVSDTYGIEDIQAELARIASDAAEADARAVAVKAQVKATETIAS